MCKLKEIKMQTFFFSQDQSCHWYMIPTELRERWNEILSWDEDDEETWEAFDEFSQYMTGGGINHIEFIPTKTDY